MKKYTPKMIFLSMTPNPLSKRVDTILLFLYIGGTFYSMFISECKYANELVCQTGNYIIRINKISQINANF